MLINTFDKSIRVHRKMIKLNKQELVDLTNRACDFYTVLKTRKNITSSHLKSRAMVQ